MIQYHHIEHRNVILQVILDFVHIFDRDGVQPNNTIIHMDKCLE